MTGAVRVCPDHGFFGGTACPDCGAPGDRLLDADRRRQLSTFLSGALRHFPDDAGLDLDRHGWADYDALLEAVLGRYDWARPEHVRAVVASDPKGRFEVDPDGRPGSEPAEPTGSDVEERPGSDDDTPRRIRAAYGHSVPVELGGGTDANDVPDTLYHGTAPRNLDAIREEGLKPMDRQDVHLSGTVEGAREVGRRHADVPAVLAVDAAAMVADGRRIVRRGEGVFVTDRVPPGYLSVREAPDDG